MFGSVAAERKAIETTYEGTAELTFQEEYTAENGATRHREVSAGVFPCALSRMGGKTAAQGEDRAVIEYDAKLFAAPEHIIPAGSKLVVSQYGRTYIFEASGEAAVYPTHQEIMLKRKGIA